MHPPILYLALFASTVLSVAIPVPQAPQVPAGCPFQTSTTSTASASAAAAPAPTPTSTTTSTPTLTSTPTSTTTSTPTLTPAAPTTPKPKPIKTTPTKVQGPQNRNCTKWLEVEAGDTCATVGSSINVTEETLRKLNPFLEKDEKCLHLWAGYDVCVDVAMPGA